MIHVKNVFFNRLIKIQALLMLLDVNAQIPLIFGRLRITPVLCAHLVSLTTIITAFVQNILKLTIKIMDIFATEIMYLMVMFYSSGNNTCEQYPLNSQPYVGQTGCQPIFGAVKINNTYKMCPQSSIPNSNRNSCMCQVENYYFDNIYISCNLCCPGQFVSALGNQCTSCQSGYVLYDASTCILIQQCIGYTSQDQKFVFRIILITDLLY
ncbi:Hypothetical_protein [Hexamita inflata]|uniref:Hypothetical_protein n=1 Tax=Hexamita inflata TaxID=28002 RepID=A0AA86TVE5_9EUKA|nr:Hypothetical protein HINF_LOCUS17774 [Hexamita inflata]